ncbi:Uncharacterised protein [Neisseria gonorrhoeae]|nr:Uncharacterised protein [Neisseria gonorrhoeae]
MSGSCSAVFFGQVDSHNGSPCECVGVQTAWVEMPSERVQKPQNGDKQRRNQRGQHAVERQPSPAYAPCGGCVRARRQCPSRAKPCERHTHGRGHDDRVLQHFVTGNLSDQTGMMTVAAVMAGMPPMELVISMAMGLVTDLDASGGRLRVPRPATWQNPHP